MNTFLQISALLYIITIAIVYFRKPKIKSLENYIYTGMIITIFIVINLDLISTIYILYYDISIITKILTKAFLGSLIAWVYLFSFYVYCASSSDNVKIIDFKENPNRKLFIKRYILMVIFMVIAILTMIQFPIRFTVDYEKEIFFYEGTSMVVTYALCAIGILSWVVMLFFDKKNLRKRKYLPVYLFFAIGTLAVILQIAFPHIALVTPAAAFITIVMFFTLENPDLHIIEELDKAKVDAEAANKAKTDFLSSMSHEIRTPLNAIVGFSQALAKEDISGTAKEEVRDIIMASNGLIEIVNGILDISKIEANKIEIVNGEYSSRKLIHEISTLVNARIGSKPLEFKVELDDNLPPVLYGDAMRIKQIIINLLTNSVKYTNEGYIRLSIKCINSGDISRITVSVEDSGMGMTEKDLELLFTKFQRFDMDKNVNVEGTGLGMAITKGLVELMNGNIDVKSEYGKGSIFTVTFEQKIIEKDIAEIEAKENEKKAIIEPFNAAGQRILVVDDNKINLKVAARLLREYNVSVELVNSGEECLNRILSGNKYDLIFLDIMMPKMKGTEVLRNLKNIEGFNIPTVALTADVIAGMEEKYISQGFDDCLPKPIVEDELYYTLKKYLKEAKDLEKEKALKEEAKKANRDIKLLENNGINVKQGIELLKDLEMYEMTLEEFFNELQEKIENLKNFKEQEDMENYSILAHGLKSEARYVGCNDLGDIAYEHEIASKENNISAINDKFIELKTEAERIYDIIKEYLGE